MSEEMYQKLNYYLNDFFLYLQKNHPIFLANLDNFYNINNEIINEFNGNYNAKIKSYNLKYDEVYYLAREIVESIDCKYLEKFDAILDSGILNFSYENEYTDSHYRYIYDYKKRIGYNEININRCFSYIDVTTLIHEFFHYTNRDGILTNVGVFLTEVVSIYFEEYAKRYLINEKKLSDDDVGLKLRILVLILMNREFNDFCLVLMAFDKLGNLSKNTSKDMKSILLISDKTFENKCKILLNKFENSNDIEIVYENLTSQYPYLICTILAYYALNNNDMKDIIKLNDLLKNERCNSYDFIELLEKINIDITDDTVFYDAFASMQKILNDDKLKK